MDADEIKRLDKKHVMHTWSVNANLDPRVIVDADGVYVFDSGGQRFLDFSSQVKCVNVGHKNSKIIKAIQEQVEKICYLSTGFAYESRSQLGKSLSEVTPGDLNKFFFTLGGADANENAIKFAKFYTKKQKILSLYRSYHGATYGALTLTGDRRRTWAEPGIPGVVHALNPFCYRCSFGRTYPECDLQCAKHIEEVVAFEDPETIAAVIIEPVIGAGGIIPPPDGYMQRLRKICTQNNILLIADEIMVGFGRTGRWFAMQHWDVVPDLMTMAKGLTSAYLPLGAVAISEKISKALDQEMVYCGLTYSGHPVSCAAAIATLEVYKEQNLIENARVMGKILKTELEKIKNRHTCVGDARSIGLFGALELVKNRGTKESMNPKKHAKEINKRFMAKGLYCPVGPMQPIMCVEIVPPLTINEAQLREGLEIIDDVLGYADTLTDS
ncbi:MAG: aspartate aminotransferase family protein [Deltaproteobacteria bacterium]|nr:MAG: aspartate aminotransferase family protein [Deltaproteobacteria bacterium]RLC19126.1 MAG: aspartate aminotransferase family protein [Deltaproteobacteria bacterium]